MNPYIGFAVRLARCSSAKVPAIILGFCTSWTLSIELSNTALIVYFFPAPVVGPTITTLNSTNALRLVAMARCPWNGYKVFRQYQI